ncbi:methyltransferase [Buchnera aphidicola]|uniref:methyltransferase n=1 Tax=Buchnera aphidicola TaxID=9 RepID=UPI0031B82D42
MHIINKCFLKNKKNFQQKKIIFIGNIQEKLFKFFNAKLSIIYTKKYNYKKYIKIIKQKKIIYLYNKNILFKFCKYLILFWSKNKKESYILLKEIISIIPLNYNIFIFGEKKSGINNIEKKIKKWVKIKKIIKIKNFLFLSCKIKKNKNKNIYKFKKKKKNKIIIYSLPGVFGYKKIDKGSLLLSKFLINKKIKGNILDIGCGTGFLGIKINYINNFNKNIKITYVDNYLPSLITTKKNLIKNKIHKKKYKIISSNIFNNINKKYNLIICNPPIHINLKINFIFIKKFLKNVKFFIKKKSEVIIVINKFISKNIFKKFKKKKKILIKNKKYYVYKLFYK